MNIGVVGKDGKVVDSYELPIVPRVGDHIYCMPGDAMSICLVKEVYLNTGSEYAALIKLG